MANIATALKTEISRIARKELRTELDALKKHSAEQRSRIAELRRQVVALSKELKRIAKTASSSSPSSSSAADAAAEGTQRRFSATRLASHRAKLGISAAAYGRLVGVSGQTIFHWEQGKARPRAAQLEALAAIRGIGKREVDKRLNEAA